MEIYRRKMTDIESKNRVTIGFERDAVKRCGLEPGGYVNVIFEDGKITIVKEINSVQV